MKVITEQTHCEPPELDDDIGAFRDLLNRGFPDRKNLFAPVGIAADADRAAAMVEYDFGVRKGTGEIGQLADLRMKQPGIEAQAERSESGAARCGSRFRESRRFCFARPCGPERRYTLP